MGGTASTPESSTGGSLVVNHTSQEASPSGSGGEGSHENEERKERENAVSVCAKPDTDTDDGESRLQAYHTQTPYTAADRDWLKSGPQSKALDPLLRILGVGCRTVGGEHPAVLVCYPLRVAQDLDRSSKKGFSTNKWNPKVGKAPVPWPNTFWLCDSDAIKKIGNLEHQGLIKKFNNRFLFPELEKDPAQATLDAEKFAAQHARYAKFRWSLLSDDDRAYAKTHGYEDVLLHCGIGSLRIVTQVKCLHLHYGHFLATNDNLVGEWCQRLLGGKKAY
jgi:hypothetical protein